MKCDEMKPVCGPCAKGNRSCVYASTSVDSTPSRNDTAPYPSASNQSTQILQQQHSHSGSLSSAAEAGPSTSNQWPTTPTVDDALQITSPHSTYSSSGYGTEVAPLRWLGLLAGDASEVSLDLPSLENLSETALAQRYRVHPDGVSIHELHTPSQSSAALAEGIAARDPSRLLHISALSPLSSSNQFGGADERQFWQAPEPILLKDHEHDMFQRFVKGVGSWIDLFDPLKHFSTFVPHLALHNEGLMKAVLAVGARHLSLKPVRDDDSNVDRTAAVQYYYETLQYLQSAMRYTSYKNSLELLATVLVVSTYEMIDGAGKGWERHLKGVFWIQRSRDINGESGGLPQANW